MSEFNDSQEKAAPMEISQRDDALVVTCLAEKMDDDRIIEQWSARLHKMLEEAKVPFLILDFTAVRFATSRVLGCLLSLKFAAREHGVTLGLAGLNEFIMEAFTMTCLDRVFVIGPDVGGTLLLLREDHQDAT